jgi:hypothetical protein
MSSNSRLQLGYSWLQLLVVLTPAAAAFSSVAFQQLLLRPALLCGIPPAVPPGTAGS